MSASSYQRMAWALDDQKCSTCHGLGRCDDAEPGDIGFNEWACTACGGSGLAQPAQSVDVQKVREVIAEIRRCAGNNNAKFHLSWADKLTAALQEKGNG